MSKTDTILGIITILCILQLTVVNGLPPSGSSSRGQPNIAVRLAREVRDLMANEKDNGISVVQDEQNMKHFDVVMKGPENSPYENGYFKLDLFLPERYPFEAPEIKFITKVYHPNIRSSNGEICMTTLKADWSPAQTMRTILESVQSLLNDPNPDSPLESEAAKLYRSDRKRYDNKVREWVKQYAKKP